MYRRCARYLSQLLITYLCCWIVAAGALELSVEEQQWLQAHPVIRVGIDPAWPPYEFLDKQGQHQGMSADYLALIAAKLKIKFVVGEPLPWSQTQKKLVQKELDITPSIAETAKRRQFLLFSQSYISFPLVILTRANESFIGQLDDLQGQRVGVEADYYTDEILQQYHPRIQRVRYPFLHDLLSGLALGQVDYILTNHASASYAVQSLHISGLKLAAVTRYDSPLSIGVRDDWPIFVSILNKALAEITPEQQQKIREKWLGVNKHTVYMTDIWRLHSDIVLLVLLLSFLLVLVAMLAYFRHRLHKRQRAAQQVQKDLVESEKRFRLLIEHAPIAFAIFKGQTGIIKMLNRCFVNTFGYKPNELYDVEDWWRCAYPNPAYREQIKQEWFRRLTIAKQTQHNLEPMEAIVRCRDGSERHIRFHSILIGTFNLVAFIDLTEQKKNEQALRSAKDTAENATKAKSLFLANMSHEIRTPMNGILGLTVLLEKTELNERQRDYVAKIYNSGEFLLGILNDILDLSKVEAGKLELEAQAFSLNQLLEPIRTLALSATQQKPVEIFFNIAIDVPSVMVGDVLRLGQILTNLLGNAIKFSANGEVELGIAYLTQYEASTLHLWVRDTGIGMTAEQLKNIFEAFNQADASTTRRFGGTGLGLTICKRLVQLMNGDIRVQSTPNEGSRFDVYIPLTFTSIDTVTPHHPVSLKLLLLDDNAHAAIATRTLIERLGWQVDVWHSLETQQSCYEQVYDYILIDASLLNERDYPIFRHNSPKVLLQTPWQENDPMLGSQLSFSHTLTKPLTEQTLVTLSQTVSTKMQVIEEKPLLGHRILLVEDNTINQLVGVRLLESLGAEVDVAENGYVALSLIQQIGNHYDLILMDLQMPVMDGLETTRQLRLIEQYADLPVIAMTANVLSTDREDCFAAGMNDFMSKPIRLEELRKKLIQWLPTL
ncbi:ATP-binding protein [Agitococcus lubricus]|uniref:histidine kinase n=1 Tax=Agitococcus lubricus TaxID=1077255 RepID=A0A2T5J1K3_9GAMM|nr:transporter substrate-binding domain-containing protein [Agitococcus lubricus]PTQ90307.1 two-component system, unclassified family, sensor histidine kinase and response regulator [Agitococcus lubricus]